VIRKGESDDYVALTAGHCFDWEEKGDYYVADDVEDQPVLRKLKILKFANDDKYDYALVSFSSLRNYEPIAIEDSDADVLPLGSSVTNVNFALGVTKEFIDGKVASGIIQGDVGGRCHVCKGRFLATLGVGPGASGSAVVDVEKQEIVGIVEAMFHDTEMPSVVMPLGKNFVDFMDDDSAGVKPLPEGPKPKDDGPIPRDEKSTLSKICWFIILTYLLT